MLAASPELVTSRTAGSHPIWPPRRAADDDALLTKSLSMPAVPADDIPTRYGYTHTR